MIVSHVVAMAQNCAIGKDGALPWHIPEDFKLFRRLTTGHAMIMGRKTYESIGKPLPGRLSIVVTRQGNIAAPKDLPPNTSMIVCTSVEEAIAQAEGTSGVWGDEVFVIGGGEVYRQTLARADRLYITEVQRVVDGDTFYPEVPSNFRLAREEPGTGDVPFVWRVYER